VCLLAYYLVYFARTRRSARGVALGLNWSVITMAASVWAQVLVAVAVEGVDALDS
jgi:hypothetical protein